MFNCALISCINQLHYSSISQENGSLCDSRNSYNSFLIMFVDRDEMMVLKFIWFDRCLAKEAIGRDSRSYPFNGNSSHAIYFFFKIGAGPFLSLILNASSDYQDPKPSRPFHSKPQIVWVHYLHRFCSQYTGHWSWFWRGEGWGSLETVCSNLYTPTLWSCTQAFA